ncbi:MAG: class I SAM-dependent methyltransferase [Clostridiales bacterium]|nr:class I SAM-dependent methyltransferase [Clostridiales bacterium]
MKPDTQQYFTNRPKSKSNAKLFLIHWHGRDFSFYTDHGVFSKGDLDWGTKVLLQALPHHFSGKMLDLGCGWGPVGLMMKAMNPNAHITMSDINERAVSLARRNAKENRLEADILLSDGMENLKGLFDLIAFNPPIRAGKTAVYHLFHEASKQLAKEGSIFIVIRKQQGAASAQKYLGTLFESVQTVAKEAGYHVFQCEGCLDGTV